MIVEVIVDTIADLIRKTPVQVNYIDNPPLMANALSAEDVRAAKLDRDAFGRIFPEIKLAVALQVLRSIRDEQIGASETVKALAAETIEVIGG